MTDATEAPTGARLAGPPSPPPDHRGRSPRVARALRMASPQQAGALYALVVISIWFSIQYPGTFPTMATVKDVLNGNAVTAIAALALVVPMATKMFDLSFAYTMSLSGVVCAHFIVGGLDPIPACALGMAAALIVGLVTGTVVVGLGINSFIATLATGFLVQSFITFFTNDNVISDQRLSGSFAKLSQTMVLGVTTPVIYALVLAVLIWVYLEHTASGRRVHAIGFNLEAARLANIRVNRIRFLALVSSSLIAGFGGLVLAATLSAGAPTAGTGYLLPAFAAVFVGSTQFKDGRFNVWGTLVAVLLIGVGTVGLSLGGAPAWASNMFNGVVLLLALCVAGLKQNAGPLLSALRRRRLANAHQKPVG
jgi:ribose transport system permease protein